MDRSFLSDPGVIAASRHYVCARLLTYEDKEEAEFLTTIFRGRVGTLENTVYTLMAPDGKTTLIRAGRTPQMVYGGSGKNKYAEMVDDLNAHAKKYPGKKEVARELPRLPDLRRALNVAACDNLPLVVVAGDAVAVEKKLTPLAWSDEFIGRALYVRTGKDDDLKTVKGAGADLLVVQPGTYGLDGAVLASGRADETRAVLEKGLKAYKPVPKDSQAHIREGHRQGVDWKTPVPDTDPGPPPGKGR